jgi:hypothetical protein
LALTEAAKNIDKEHVANRWIELLPGIVAMMAIATIDADCLDRTGR